VDHGRWLAGFADEFVVRCPRCGAAATVVRDWDFAKRRWMLATAVCVSCGFSRRQQPSVGCECGRCRRTVPDGWAGPVVIAVHRRCGHCGRAMQIRRRARAVPQSRLVTMTCDGCGTSTDVSYGMWPVTVPDALVDNCFGLPLRLQVPCAGHVLWAFNARHLAYLKEFLQADLRQRRGATNASVVSRLPGWLKQAKHRAEALRAVERLERLLLETR
jgi:transcription elongation factor Elf1